MVSFNREKFRREQKAKGKDNTEIKKALDDVTDVEKLENELTGEAQEYEDLMKKGP